LHPGAVRNDPVSSALINLTILEQHVTTEQVSESTTLANRIWAFLRRYRLWLGLAVVVVALVVVILIIRHNAPIAPQPGGRRGGFNGQVAVGVAKVTSGDILIRIPALGAISPLATVTVKTQISGQLQKIAFQEGQMVKAGEFLAQIDPRPYEAALRQVTANLHRDEALLANARLDLKRYQGLIAENSIAQQQMDTQKTLVQQYEGAVEADQAQVSTAALNLQYTHIVSPIVGRVGLRQVDQGNYVTPGDANGIVVVTQLQPITAVFSIPEDNIGAISQRLHEGATLPVEAYDRGNTAKIADGKLLTIDNQIDATTGTFKLRALFENKDGTLFANQFVNIRLLVNVLHDQIIIPNSAVHRGAPNGVVSTFVYLVNADKTVTVRPVVLGVVDGERVAVTSGLDAGDVVVTEGGDRLRDGSTVSLPTEAPTPGASGANGGERKPGQHRGDGSKRPRKRPGSEQ
jgi:multidrug efflux system membrane fusion protein